VTSADADGQATIRFGVDVLPRHTRCRPADGVDGRAGSRGLSESAEPAAAEAMLRYPLRRGTPVVVPRANRSALAAGTRIAPIAKSADLARCVPRSDGEAPRGELATAIGQLVLPAFVVKEVERWFA
jgi:predicted deacylase